MTIAEIISRTAPLLRQYGITEAYLFGSTARNENRTDSDIDILVKLKKNSGLFEFVKIKLGLQEALGGRLVDLVQMEALRKEFRASVEKEKIQIV